MLLSTVAHHASNSSTYILVIVAVIGIIPGIGAFMMSNRQRRDAQRTDMDSVGLAYTQTAFLSLEKEVVRMGTLVKDFDSERSMWDHDRKVWATDKASLIAKISEMTQQLHTTNNYLQLLLMVLDQHQITPPAPPPGYGGGKPIRKRGQSE